MLTAYDDFEFVRNALRAGAADYLLKPVRPAEVMRHIHAASAARADTGLSLVTEKESRQAHRRSWPPAVRAAADYIEAHLDEKLTLELLAKVSHSSSFHLSRLFTRHTGKTLMTFVQELRIEKAKELLADASFSITDVAIQTGFSSSAYFTDCFKKLTGHSPSQYRKMLYRTN